MARTIRRKHYVPGWVTEDEFHFVDPATGVSVSAGWIQLQGKDRQRKVRWWHAEHTRFQVRPPKAFRKAYEVRHRIECKQELARQLNHDEYDATFLPKKPLGYWL